jgi:hypothetical protein
MPVKLNGVQAQPTGLVGFLGNGKVSEDSRKRVLGRRSI